MYKTALIAGLIALATTVGCEAAKAAGNTPTPKAKPAAKSDDKSGGLLKRSSFSGGEYATVFTILCMESKGPDGARMVDLMAKSLRNVKGVNPSLVKTDTDGAKNRLYYGAYKGQTDKATDTFIAPPKAKEDLNLIRSMASGNMQPFILARVVEMPTPDVGPAEWNLKNAPGVYTLQICHCFDKPGLPNHKEVAVAICKALREQGEEAWYLHNDRVSVVTAGHFDESAVVRDDQTGNLSYGSAVIALQNKREEFKYNTENLLKVVRVINGKRFVAPSALIYIREPANESAGQQSKPAASPTANPFGY